MQQQERDSGASGQGPRRGNGAAAPPLPGSRPERFSIVLAALVALGAVAAWWSGRDSAHPLRGERVVDVCAQAAAVGIAAVWAGRTVSAQAVLADPQRGQAGACRYRDTGAVPELLLGDLTVSTMSSLGRSDSVHSQDAMVRHVGMLEWERGVRIGQPGAEVLSGPWREAVRFTSRRPGEATVVLIEDHGVFIHWRGDPGLEATAVADFLRRFSEGLRGR